MARPIKEGLDYFPLDVTLDDKMELIEAEFGLTGFAVVVKLLQKIYGRGYYCEWTNDVALLFAKRIGLGGNVVSEIVSASIKRGIFNSDLYDRFGILTSHGIQKRYFEAVGRREKITVKKEYLLVSADSFSVNVDINSINVDRNPINVDINSQSKVKESKVKESINNGEGETSPAGAVPYKKIQDMYNQICISLPKVKNLSDQRKKAIRARLNKYTINDLKELFFKAEASDFLKGGGAKNFTADFDWLLKDANMAKVLDGKYDNKGAAAPDNSYSDIEALTRGRMM